MEELHVLSEMRLQELKLLRRICRPLIGSVRESANLAPPATSSPRLNDNLMITDSCVEKLKTVASDGEFLRVMIDGGGCSGYEYKFSLDDKLAKDDVAFERNGVKVVVDELSLEFMKGSTVDYAEELIKSSFRVLDNPQAEKGCSCGASFASKS